MPFINDDFLLTNETARRLYPAHAQSQPILDYHCHLSPADIAEDRQFDNLHEIWLEGDHYKWRAMRANGVPEPLCTGNAAPKEKFLAWAATVPHTLRNPLYHWTHLELKRYFDIDELLGPDTAEEIWNRANERLRSKEFSARGILGRFNVKALCTTDDPADDLAAHRKIAESDLTAKVFPAFRPDKALTVHQPAPFNAWVNRLGEAADAPIEKFDDLLEALESRHRAFHDAGCRLSDHGMERCPSQIGGRTEAARVFGNARNGQAAAPEEHDRYAGFMMHYFGQLDAKRGWTKQLHLGAMRNNNTRAFEQIGPDAGFDSIGDYSQARSLAAYLDALEKESALPKFVLYNNNPNDNFIFATMIGNFMDGVTPGKIQFGSGWWHLDQMEGMEWQMNALSNTGLLSRFIGMLTDSRSFMSYPRHEYFRRILCNLIGRDVEEGLIPKEDSLVGPLIEDICYRNAKNFLNLPLE